MPEHIYTDPRQLGEIMALRSVAAFSRGAMDVNYLCMENKFRLVAGGSPFRVDVAAIKEDGEEPMFNVMNTGDGLTFQFSNGKKLDGVDQSVTSGARDQAARMKAHI
jgi:3-phosphoglycerate kinase